MRYKVVFIKYKVKKYMYKESQSHSPKEKASAYRQDTNTNKGVGLAPPNIQLVQRKNTPIQKQVASTNPELEAELENIQVAYGLMGGLYHQQIQALEAFYHDINTADSPTVTDQILEVAVMASVGSAIGFIGARIATNCLGRLRTGSSIRIDAVNMVIENIKDVSKDEAKLAAREAMRSSSEREVKIRFVDSIRTGINRAANSTVQEFNRHRQSFRESANGLEEARAMRLAIDAQNQNAFELQYANLASEWASLRTNMVGQSSPGVLSLEIHTASAGDNIHIVSSSFSGINEQVRTHLSGFRNVRLKEIDGLIVNLRGEHPHWIFGTPSASDDINITGRFAAPNGLAGIPQFQHSGTTAYFLIQRGIARHHFEPDSIRSIPDPLQETAAVLLFVDIGNMTLDSLGSIEG